MSIEEVVALRLAGQQISMQQFTSAPELVSYMGALQAQDFGMAKWAIGLRVPGTTDAMLNSAIARGEIIRTHVLRPTWHFVSPADVCWMLALTGKRIKAAMAGNDRKLGLDAAVFKKANRTLEKAFTENQFLTRDEIRETLIKGGIEIFESRLSHVLMHAELDGLICSGEIRNRRQTYAWMDAHIAPARSKSKEEALAELARRYFTSHGPATGHDFSWWSGLTLGEVRTALELVKPELTEQKISNKIYYAKEAQLQRPVSDGVYFLPAFDEFLVGYADRSAVLHLKHNKNIITNNGMFFPVVVANGAVTGHWKKAQVKGATGIEPTYFLKKNTLKKRVLKEAEKKYAAFFRP